MPTGTVVMAFDYGMKRIGVAVGQSITGTANPLTVLAAKDGIPDWIEVENLLNEWQPVHIVVGLPLNMDDTPSLMSARARKFGRRLSGRFNITHSTVDERLSTYEARGLVKNNRVKNTDHGNDTLDAIAAKLILETYFSQR